MLRSAARFLWRALEDLGWAYAWLLLFLIAAIAAILPLVIVFQWLGI